MFRLRYSGLGSVSSSIHSGKKVPIANQGNNLNAHKNKNIFPTSENPASAGRSFDPNFHNVMTITNNLETFQLLKTKLDDHHTAIRERDSALFVNSGFNLRPVLTFNHDFNIKQKL